MKAATVRKRVVEFVVKVVPGAREDEVCHSIDEGTGAPFYDCECMALG